MLSLLICVGCFRDHTIHPADASPFEDAAPPDGAVIPDVPSRPDAGPRDTGPDTCPACADAGWPDAPLPPDEVPTHACRIDRVAAVDRLDEEAYYGMAARVFDTLSSPIFVPLVRGGTPHLVALDDACRVVVVTPEGEVVRRNAIERCMPSSQLAAADLDGDGHTEVVLFRGRFPRYDETGSVALRLTDGALLWESPYPSQTDLRFEWARFAEAGAAEIVDLDRDGQLEVVLGNIVLDGRTGLLRWRGETWDPVEVEVPTHGRGINRVAGPMSCAVDVVGDGDLEVLAGRTLYDADGHVLWDAPTPDGLCAVGDVLPERGPEFVLVAEGDVYVLDPQSGSVLATHPLPGRRGGPQGGAPALADLDGDGRAEIVVAHKGALVAIDALAGLEWSVPIDDGSGASTPVVFDPDGDGRWEVAHNDEHFLRVIDGARGEVLLMVRNEARTRTEAPAIADVDLDGQVEIVVGSSNRPGETMTPRPGLRVFGDREGRWVGAEPGFVAQHAFGVRLRPDLRSVRSVEDGFRVVAPAHRDTAPDLDLAFADAECRDDGRARLRVWVQNTGEAVAERALVEAWQGDRRLGEARSPRLRPGRQALVHFDVELASELPVRFVVDGHTESLPLGAVTECEEDDGEIVVRVCEDAAP